MRWSALILVLLASCGPTISADFSSPEPAARNAAIVQAAQHKDPAAIPDLVRMLDSDDPATRLLAINALERITGERNGFDPAGPQAERRQAADRWQKYVEEHRSRAGSSLPLPPAAPPTSLDAPARSEVG